MNTIKDKTGILLVDPVKIDSRWAEYFTELMNVPREGDELEDVMTEPAEQDQDNVDDEITEQEVLKAIKQMKSNRSTGVDEIPAEIYKCGGEAMLTRITDLFNTMWKSGEVPEDWGKAIICPVHKKGDLLECGNYRGISLLPHIAKM